MIAHNEACVNFLHKQQLNYCCGAKLFRKVVDFHEGLACIFFLFEHTTICSSNALLKIQANSSEKRVNFSHVLFKISRKSCCCCLNTAFVSFIAAIKIASCMWTTIVAIYWNIF